MKSSSRGLIWSLPWALGHNGRVNQPTSWSYTMSQITTASGLVIEEVLVGEGAEARAGQTVSVHYTGWLTNGSKFDSSKDRNEPFQFPLGARHVIAGWDEGVQGMKIGGTRKLTIPPQLGYGARGAGGVIPPNATLVFEVELLGLE
jgi:FKBP-type peptidyl-prolyl cis-trans isomerase FkpA